MAGNVLDKVEKIRREPPPWLLPVIALDVILRALAARRAVQNGQKVWALAIGLVNSMGILPVVYLLWFQHDHDEADDAPADAA